MARYHHSDLSDAPTMIMSPTNGAQLPHNSMRSHSFSGDPGTDDSLPVKSHRNNSTSWTPVDTMTPVSTNPSRKRSRDESDLTLNHDGSYFHEQKVNTPAPIPEEPIYGEGMVLLNPSTGISISAESQTGTWYEEKVEAGSASLPGIEDRPRMPTSRKSVRLDHAAPPSPRPDDIVAAVAPESLPKSSSSASYPTIDDFTYALGIGWTRLATEDPDIQAAARGWARYLENHYSRRIHGAEILLKSKGLTAYLVGCQDGFYLFSEDLLEGRLVGRNWESCLSNLQANPITFEGAEVLRAERTPAPESGVSRGFRYGNETEKGMSNGNDAGINGQMDVD
ncbi:hypothetical protein GJ744_011977 [Endocarpon pusillum]|uniref:Uncharacterized protein n=1 Tax=Endocarpon pusillum TaxID=364733 RepID=A0A8H7E743_9EURO|nr:hypothetical protein GJ744_011977 [Endocarpon pusillum]